MQPTALKIMFVTISVEMMMNAQMCTHNCDSSVKADCYNIEGSFRCSCKEGFSGGGTAGNCTGL